MTDGFTSISLVSMATCGIVNYYITASIVRDLTIHSFNTNHLAADVFRNWEMTPDIT